jgi:hypothetical protein
MVRVVRTPAIYHTIFREENTSPKWMIGVYSSGPVKEKVKPRPPKKVLPELTAPPVKPMQGKGVELT